jgi:cytochrome c peroxidase
LDAATVDAGVGGVTHASDDMAMFKVPLLRNIELTAPYMHDGRFATLEEAVAHYSTGIHRGPALDPNLAKHPEAGLRLSVADQRALVAFLKALSSE